MLIVITLATAFLAVLLMLRKRLARSAALRTFGAISPAFFVVHCVFLAAFGLHKWFGLAANFSPWRMLVALILSIVAAVGLRWYLSALRAEIGAAQQRQN